MKYRKRRYFTQADKNLMWDRWQKGEGGPCDLGFLLGWFSISTSSNQVGGISIHAGGAFSLGKNDLHTMRIHSDRETKHNYSRAGGMI